MSRGAELRRRLRADRPLILAGVYDGLSARIAERAGFEGLWASGFCISASKCMPDVGLLSMHEHLTASAAIQAASRVPVIADIDDGFGDALNVVRAVREYEAAGLAGVCLEDNQHPKRNSLYAGFERKLVSAQGFARKIEAATEARRDRDFVVIARTEALVAGLGQAEALARARVYADAGADVVLVHAKANTPAPILEFGRAWDRPVPLAAVPSTYPQVDPDELFRAGYRLIIFANQGMRAAVAAMERSYRAMIEARSLAAVESQVSPLSTIFSLVEFEEVNRLSARYSEHAPRSRDNLWHRLLVDNPAARPERVALRSGRVALTYGELTDAVRSVAFALLAAGIGAGDRVALMLRNSPEYVVLFLAIVAIGAIAAPIDPGAGAERHAQILQDTAPRMCVVLAGEGHDGMSGGPPRVAVRIDAATKAVEFSPRLTVGREETRLPEVTGETDACILSSAGSTGRPKGVVLKHRHLLAIAGSLAQAIGMGPEHCDLIVSPMTHSGGFQRVTATLLRGGTVAIFEGMFSVAALLDDVRRFAVSGFFTTPPVVRALLRADAGKFAAVPSGFRSIEIASAPIRADELMALSERFAGASVFVQYGLTECSRALMVDTRRHPDKRHTVGAPTPGVEVMICDDSGAPLERGQEGEICLRAPQRSERYWNLPDANPSRVRGEWLCTGDYGVIDAEGFVEYRGRRDDVINCGGNSYFPAEVELLLGELPGVQDSMVAGVPDPQGILGQVPWIFVVPYHPEGWSAAEFTARARARLPAHMVPRNVVIVPRIATTNTGKPSRREMVRLHGPGRGQS